MLQVYRQIPVLARFILQNFSDFSLNYREDFVSCEKRFIYPPFPMSYIPGFSEIPAAVSYRHMQSVLRHTVDPVRVAGQAVSGQKKRTIPKAPESFRQSPNKYSISPTSGARQRFSQPFCTILPFVQTVYKFSVQHCGLFLCRSHAII